MFLLFGEKYHANQVATGQFECPICLSETHYTHHRVQPKFTLFGIGIAKLEITSDYVICHQCNSCYDPQIIATPSEQHIAIDKAALIRTLCYILSGYGDTGQSRTRLIQLYKQVTNIDITNQDISTELAVINSGKAPTLPFLKQVALRLSPKAKQDIIVACYQFASGSCLMEHQDHVRINTIASSLDISLPEVEYLINHNA